MSFETYREYFLENCLMAGRGNSTRLINSKLGQEFYDLMEKFGVNKYILSQMLKANIQEVKKCKHCGKILEKSIDLEYCSYKCSANSKETREKFKQTCLEQHGVKNAGGTKESIEKGKQTRIKKHGSLEEAMRIKEEKRWISYVEMYGSIEEAMKIIGQSVSKTIRTKYTPEELSKRSRKGTPKRKITNLKKYGVENTWNIKMCSRSHVSKAENEIYEELHKIFPKLIGGSEHKKEQLKLPNPEHKGRHYFYDMYLDDKIIEYNGNHFHCNPLYYHQTQYINHSGKWKNVTEIWCYDRKKLQTAFKKGHKVLIIWEDEWSENKEGVIKKAIEFLKS